MPLPRLLALILGIGIILGLTIWLVSSLGGLYSQVAWSASPLLANLLLVLILGVLATLLGTYLYYLKLYWTPKSTTGSKKRPLPKVPEAKADAATENLRAVRKQVSQIQDEVARQSLLNRSREIESTLSRGDLQVVVFGTGSAGKTSLINALMGRMVGSVAAPMGTTETGATYPLELPGLDRKILMTDTPGILEAGEEGAQRAQVARQLATDANLLVFVVDNDLLASEYAPLATLLQLGKRSIVALNKIDLLPDTDRELILGQLRSRLGKLVPPSDIVAIAANPPSVRLETGEIVTPDPDIMPLIRRLVAVLRAQGEDSIADNILLQSQQLGDRAREILDGQRRRQAMKIVDRFQWIGAGAIAVTPLPVVDLLATVAVNAQMVVEIGHIYGCELNLERGRELALSLGKTLASLGIVKGAVQLVGTALQFHVGTLLVGKAIQGVSAAYLTRIAGKSFIEYFRQEQDWGDGGMTEVVQRQFQLTRRDEFMKAFVKDAIARVVEPLQRNSEPDTEEELIFDPEFDPQWESTPEEVAPPKPMATDNDNDWENPRPNRDW
ncbi:MAG: GTP-binding protein [Cyanobacteriota bacterium]|nr:GTP-binding protein [Cyanobacteriota bacterium]